MSCENEKEVQEPVLTHSSSQNIYTFWLYSWDWPSSFSLLLFMLIYHVSLCASGMLIRRVVNISLGVLIAYLSVPVVLNLLSSRQVMNTSFDPLRIVNTYGAFGRYSQDSLGSGILKEENSVSVKSKSVDQFVNVRTLSILKSTSKPKCKSFYSSQCSDLCLFLRLNDWSSSFCSLCTNSALVSPLSV